MKLKCVVYASLISISALFAQEGQNGNQNGRRINRYPYCSDAIGDDLPAAGGTMGLLGLLYKGAVCCLTSDPLRENDCCYKFGCNYSWCPPCNQGVQCIDNTTFHSGPTQWITTAIVIGGCGLFLPWTIEKCRHIRSENQNLN